ncbi:formate--tetrahydrofolate ligase, partial [Micrococcus sp. SIMBA_144]
LDLTGGMHAMTTGKNGRLAGIDNHMNYGNELKIDERSVTWKRVLDMNDRALRQVVVALGRPTRGVPSEDGFDITVASEIMAVLCLAGYFF